MLFHRTRKEYLKGFVKEDSGKSWKKAGGKVEIIRFSVVCVEMSSNIE
jgi:hypothetical protein